MFITLLFNWICITIFTDWWKLQVQVEHGESNINVYETIIFIIMCIITY